MLVGALDLVRRDLNPAVITATLSDALSGTMPTVVPQLSHTGVFGNRERAAKAFIEQTGDNCSLVAVAIVMSQLSHKPTNLGNLEQTASQLDSVIDENGDGAPEKMYNLNREGGVHGADAVVLLQHEGYSAAMEHFKNKNDAMATVQQALQSGQAVLVGLHSYAIWKATVGVDGSDGKTPANDHMVVVTEVDMDKKIVYINDPALGPKGNYINEETGKPDGQNLAVPLDVFLTSWRASKYQTIFAGNNRADSVPAARAA
jgi:hypothetical protein